MTHAPDELPQSAPGRWCMLALICIGVVGVLSTWFSATAIIPELVAAWELSPSQSAWLTNAVQLGFVFGALGSSLVNLPDILPMKRLMTAAALLATLANAALLVAGPDTAIAARFVTGVALAGVYPPALKLMSTWFLRGRGLALGFLIGALTLGSSMPHLLRALTSGIDWRAVVWGTSAAALTSALLFALTLREGPYAFGRASFDPRQALSVFRRRPLMLANLGYFGHMWELYGMWAWFLAFAAAAQSGGLVPFPFGTASMLSFVVVASGVLGCLLGGWLSDRIGRCLTCAGMMIVSGTCAGLVGVAFDGPALLLGAIAVVWGITIVGDSAQFSAAVTELSEPHLVGTALALQLGIGFALTVVAIWLLPIAAAAFGGWRWTFLILLPGPLVGTLAMLALRRHPLSERLAQGAR